MFKPCCLFFILVSVGRALEEKKPCMSWDDDRVTRSAALTSSSCKTNSCAEGCCRYHTAFLTCDDDDDFPHQPCVCNDITDNSHLQSTEKEEDRETPTGTTSGGGSVGGIVTNLSSAPVPTPAPGPTSVTIQSNNAGSCSNGSPYQNLGLPFTNCNAASDCEGVLINGVQTCCKRAFCFCGLYDVEGVECAV